MATATSSKPSKRTVSKQRAVIRPSKNKKGMQVFGGVMIVLLTVLGFLSAVLLSRSNLDIRQQAMEADAARVLASPTPSSYPSECEEMVVRLQEDEQSPLVEVATRRTDRSMIAQCLKKNRFEDGPIPLTYIMVTDSRNQMTTFQGGKANIRFSVGTNTVRCMRYRSPCSGQRSSNTATVSGVLPPIAQPYSGTINKLTGDATFLFTTLRIPPTKLAVDIFLTPNATQPAYMNIATGVNLPDSTPPQRTTLRTTANLELANWQQAPCGSTVYWNIRRAGTPEYFNSTGAPVRVDCSLNYQSLTAKLNTTSRTGVFSFTVNPKPLQETEHSIQIASSTGANSPVFEIGSGKTSPIVTRRLPMDPGIVCGRTIYWRIQPKNGSVVGSWNPVTLVCQ